ncbi:uncharacterized protein Aud_000200 [Aspergillus udagawae]|uniref:Secreted LysM effector LysM C-terminal domain-containing protein n=1 Tax=Aspergillus udagawae TaxID=91492 RepID=A0A8E0QGN3_9EURO|nr:uncharacterized protein Aud_000200 [Aspergillus udagawae]GIC84384.1 hypothetical protein Aud_000200 [Aspergillus udagawae]
MALFSDGNAAVYVNDHIVEWDSMPQTDVKGDGDISASIWFGSIAAPPGMVTIDLFVHDSLMTARKTLDITTSCDGGFNNFNAWVGSVQGSWYGPSSTSVNLKEQVCVKGKGAYDFNALCSFTCSYGYCPVSACTCEQMGVAFTKPNATGTTGYPAEGKDANYKGLCSFACNYGYYPSRRCDTTEHPMPVPTVSDFLPPACVAGTGDGAVLGLYSYVCSFGYCPINLCTCTKTGPLVQPPAQTESASMAAPGQPKKFDNLCDFTCSRGYCPPGTCISEAEQKITEAEQEIMEAIAASGYNTSNFTNFNLTILGTALISKDGCTPLQKQQIKSGWVESWEIMNYMYKVAKAGINFNEAAAVEYLGPPSMNQDQWSNYKAIYLNLATIQPGWRILDPFDWFAWKIAVRCNDPRLQCSCGRDVNTITYTVQKDPKHQVTAINFCPQYFSLQTLKDTMYWADTTHTPQEYSDLNNYYNNQALVWIHELLHINWVSTADSSENNIHHVSDIKVGYEEGNKGAMRYYTAYGPRMCKALARLGWATGLWTIQNADSLTLYAFAKYVQNALGKIYPHLPLAPAAPKSARIPFEINGLFTLYNNGTGERVLNTTLNNKLEWSLSQGVCAATDDDDGDEAASAVMTTMTTWPLVIMGQPDTHNHNHSGNGHRNRTWTMSIYSEVNCTGDSYVVEGQNLDSTSDQCLVIADLGTSDKGTSASWKWYTAGSDLYISCDQSTLTEPLPWQLTGTGVVCTAYDNSSFNDDGSQDAYTANEGCQKVG